MPQCVLIECIAIMIFVVLIGFYENPSKNKQKIDSLLVDVVIIFGTNIDYKNVIDAAVGSVALI